MMISAFLAVGFVVNSTEPAILLQRLRQNDALFAHSSIRLRVTRPVSPTDLEQGMETFTGAIHSSGETIALRFDVAQEKAPSYVPPGTRGYRTVDYNPDGALIVWRTVSINAFSSPDTNKNVVKNHLREILPDNSVRDLGLHDLHYLYDIGNQDNIYLVNQTLLASGRGFSGHLKRINRVELLGDDLLQIVASGNYGESQSGIWELTLERHNLLVRAAEFVRDDGVTVVQISTDGIVDGGSLTISQEGKIQFPFRNGQNLTVTVVSQSLSQEVDPMILAEISKLVTQKPDDPNAITDFRKMR